MSCHFISKSNASRPRHFFAFYFFREKRKKSTIFRESAKKNAKNMLYHKLAANVLFWMFLSLKDAWKCMGKLWLLKSGTFLRHFEVEGKNLLILPKSQWISAQFWPKVVFLARFFSHFFCTIRRRNYRFLSQILDILPPGKLV